MTSKRSLDQAQADYIAAMGNELGAAFFPLYRKLIELHIVWQQYIQLYGSNTETVHVLNRTAGLFFMIIQDELWDSVLLGISRMTDPPSTGKNKNLTVQSLRSLVDDAALRAEIEILCEAAAQEATFAREHRNKRIAHQDHDYTTDRASNPLSGISQERVEAMLASLRKVLNRLDSHFRGSTVLYEKFIDESGARVLVAKLKNFERLKAAGGAV